MRRRRNLQYLQEIWRRILTSSIKYIIIPTLIHSTVLRSDSSDSSSNPELLHHPGSAYRIWNIKIVAFILLKQLFLLHLSYCLLWYSFLKFSVWWLQFLQQENEFTVTESGQFLKMQFWKSPQSVHFPLKLAMHGKVPTSWGGLEMAIKNCLKLLKMRSPLPCEMVISWKVSGEAISRNL